MDVAIREYSTAHARSQNEKRRVRLFGPAALAHRSAPDASSSPPRLERVDEIGRQRILSVPQMLRAGHRVDEIVVRKRILTRIVMPVFQACDESGHFRNLVADRLGYLPQRLRLAVGA